LSYLNIYGRPPFSHLRSSPFFTANPNVCKGKEYGQIVGPLKDIDRLITQINAYTVSLQLFEEKLKSGQYPAEERWLKEGVQNDKGQLEYYRGLYEYVK
jgi:hypothetical protein